MYFFTKILEKNPKTAEKLILKSISQSIQYIILENNVNVLKNECIITLKCQN